jgi:hypothetical protein
VDIVTACHDGHVASVGLDLFPNILIHTTYLAHINIPYLFTLIMYEPPYYAIISI